jgi:hypothetical protein
VYVEDDDGEEVCLLEYVPLPPDDDADEAVAALSAEWSAEQEPVGS